MAAKLPFKYTGAVVLGSNVSGAFTSIIAIFSTMFASSPRTAAIYYFIGAMFVLLACFDTYFALPLNVCANRWWEVDGISFSFKHSRFSLVLIHFCSDFIGTTNWCTKRKRKRHANWEQQEIHGHRIGKYSRKRFHNCSMFSSCFSSHWLFSPWFNQVNSSKLFYDSFHRHHNSIFPFFF